MRKPSILLIFLFLAASCQHSDITPNVAANMLVGTNWGADMGYDSEGHNYYERLKFQTETTCYFIRYRDDKIMSVSKAVKFTRKVKNLTFYLPGRTRSASIDGNVLSLSPYEYYELPEGIFK